ncbi:protein-tyrosine phosphatase-like protein [Halteromyces radiatus]|uniref:protein-tyrosine phosphatase-like protein n=1 Tax=Halteromyces radiatus TaxID=101107 RepID=UPI00221FF09E|nr:protein-tyrosine phosphatase-like protein [Halteromyces radiatus]KAI8099062.1 protein-tyrosine phosphatase-like protein [Halteromyces radiatus]
MTSIEPSKEEEEDIQDERSTSMDDHSHLFEKLSDYDGKPGGILMTSLAQQVLPNIWIGGYAAMESKSFLKKNKIQTILSLGHFQSIYPTTEFTHKIIPITDHPETNIIRWFPEAFRFITEALEKEEKILVHCLAGVSRSPTVVAGYMMEKEHLRWKLALAKIKQTRPFVDPNPGFKKQLQLFQDMGYVFDPSHPAYRDYIKHHPRDAAHQGHSDYISRSTNVVV